MQMICVFSVFQVSILLETRLESTRPDARRILCDDGVVYNHALLLEAGSCIGLTSSFLYSFFFGLKLRTWSNHVRGLGAWKTTRYAGWECVEIWFDDRKPATAEHYLAFYEKLFSVC